MKIQAIKKLCMEKEVFYLFNCGNGQQFLSNGDAAWPVEGIKLTESMIPILFDISQKQQDKVAIRAADWPDERFTVEPYPGETELAELGTVWNCGTLYKALKGPEGVLFIDVSRLKPGENKEGEYRFYERDAEGKTPFVAVYGDMLACALVMPVKARCIMETLEKICYEPLHPACDEKKEEG